MRSHDLNAMAFALAQKMNVTFGDAKRVLASRGGRVRARNVRTKKYQREREARARAIEERISP